MVENATTQTSTTSSRIATGAMGLVGLLALVGLGREVVSGIKAFKARRAEKKAETPPEKKLSKKDQRALEIGRGELAKQQKS